MLMKKNIFDYLKFHIKRLILKLIFLIFVIILRILNKIFNIRIGGVDLSSFGQLIFFEYYSVKKKILGQKTFDIIYCYKSFENIGNTYTKKFFGRRFNLYPFGNFLERVNNLNLSIKGSEKSSINFGISIDHILHKNEIPYEKEIIREFKSNLKPMFNFTEQELNKGNKILEKFGIKKSG